jgi:iron(III) transport system ATP-binding protein
LRNGPSAITPNPKRGKRQGTAARETLSYLEIEGIRKDFGAFTALRDIHLVVAQGEFVCFLGPSGCGKTTLLRVIAGLEVQSAGTVRQGGRDISRLPPAQRDYGIVFQSYALFPNLSVFDNVGYGLVNRRAPRAQVATRVAELLRLVGLPDAGAKYPSQLSGGQQQRIALARALATSPGLLLLDEPLSALDALERVRLRQEIRALQQRLGVTTIMVTHDQEEALSMADRIVVMNHGMIEQVGNALQIYREPASPFVADFVGKVNVLQGVSENSAVRVGETLLECNGTDVPKGNAVKIYLRPEDVVARPIAAGDSNVLDARIEKVEFLGSYCLVRVAANGLAQPLTVYLSLNFLSEESLEPGKTLKLRILPERLRLFSA